MSASVRSGEAKISLDEKIRRALRPLEEATPLELIEALPHLTYAQAEARIKHAKKVTASIIQQGRCQYCGCKRHKSGRCRLKEESDRTFRRAIIERHR